ncbi:MAG: hypothetical protein VX920_05435 [Pseudomonadota bacterium]|nr:hypothetical protein [Pseudomonadota bacterium]
MQGDSGQGGLHPDQLRGALLQSPAYRSLSAEQQAELANSMSKVFGYLGNTPDAPARQLAPDLDALRRGASGSPAPGSQQPAPAPSPATPAPQQGQSAVDRTGAAAQNLLGAIDFPGFVASLVQGTFQAIVDASIQQMEAYAKLLQEVSKTVDDFMADNVTDDMAKDHLADTYGDVFQRDFRSGRPQLAVTQQQSQAGQLPTFLQDLGFDSPADIDSRALNDVVVPETRRSLAEMRHQSLATRVMMGINRVVVDDGEINAKLIFNVNASEALTFNFDEHKPTNWTLAGTLGRNPFGASGIMVQTTNMNAQQDLNVRADLTGEVKIKFRSETFPLERFADSAAIQLINTRATVPDKREKPAPATNGNSNNAAPVDTSDSDQGPTLSQSQARLSAPQPTDGHDPWLPRKKS